ncbi:versiconal hemiacetal acetate reductase [Aspergillus udagawae]|uniref:Versiconal hemiacetal acetate reductase n=1 Tax=Aspergillus udagawae TaxID=91492 RepID=A0A8H3XRU4_9EURO|nr:versiconal hemiacetal acetate reductase [Aspergillus udagawae]
MAATSEAFTEVKASAKPSIWRRATSFGRLLFYAVPSSTDLIILERLAQRIREAYFSAILRQDAAFFDNLPAGEVSARITDEISVVQQGTNEKVGIVIRLSAFGQSHRVANARGCHRVGDSGLYVSKIILGTASYGSPRRQEWILNEEAALPLLKHAYDMGINTWDTADAYSNGRSEEIIGKALRVYKIPREQVVILTKIFYALDPDDRSPIAALMDKNKQGLVKRVGLSHKHIMSAVAESIERLGTYIDVLQIHRLDRDVSLMETMKVLNDVVESGQVRYLGASSMATWEFQKLQNIAEQNGWHEFISMQNYCNLLYREEEREMIPFCQDTGVGILPWSPLARGVLAHPWTERETAREQTDKLLQRLVRGHETLDDKEVVDRVTEVAAKRGVKMAIVALVWCHRKGLSPITGLGSTSLIDDAVQAVTFQLADDEVKYLEDPYRPKPVVY